MIGRGAYVGSGVRMGDNCKLQNYALVYEPAELGGGVFIGLAVLLTNDHNPRSVNPEDKQKRGGDWEAVGVTIADGHPSAPGPYAWRPSVSDAGPWWPRAPWSPRTFRTSPWWPAGRARGETGVWECPKSGRLYRETPEGPLPEAE